MFEVRVLTPAYLLTGEIEENSSFVGWLNNKNKLTIDLNNVEGIMLNPESPMPATSAKMVTLPKNQVVGIDMLSPKGRKTIQLPERTQLATFYTVRFIIQANLHPTGDMLINNIPNVSNSDFVATTEVKLHPLLPTRQFPNLETAMMIFNWQHIDFYHAC